MKSNGSGFFNLGNALHEAMAKQHSDDRSFAIRDIIIGMLKKSGNGVITISPGIARRILNEANFPHQRGITADRLFAAKKYILDEVWRDAHAITFALLPDGRFWLVNGQTRMTAISDTEKQQRVTVLIEKVKDEHDARHFYTEFDKGSGVRTAEQTINASGVKEQFGLTGDVAKILYAAVPIIANGMTPPMSGAAFNERAVKARNVDNRLQMIGEWHKEAKMFYDDIREAGLIKKKLLRASTMSVALVTYRHQQAKAHNFWMKVATGDQLMKNDPRLTLSRDLGDRGKMIGKVGDGIQQSALAWNAFYENRELKIIKVISDWNPYIAGTPYHSKGKS